ncbi:MAG: cysteine--tRNA ligase [Oscillospiraceae bacterium]|jgi:cysteinyl-tRNA synthetase|nr:cysteine--tRNA ligase [Oscillospiraceae bacterium]
MKLFNTLTRAKEDFVPITPGQANMYCCGPTVYGFAHIGNMRTYLFMDWLCRALRLAGIKPFAIMNITDVGHLVSDADDGEDKMEKSARERKKSPWDIAREYTDAFMRDIDALNIARPALTPRATEHIPEMIAFVEGLYEKGFGYETSDGIYFDISRFPGYGKLSRLNLDEQQAGARVEVNAEKRHPADFALWKKAPIEHIMQWESPWGMGYPGWHIECSAMGRKYLGDKFDIHTGGVDHIPVHHENEIAQSEALLGHPAVNVWMHGEFMLVDGGKMSKSLQNCWLLSDLAKRGYSPMHFRFFCANAHYRSKLNFTWEGLESAKTSYERLLAALNRHKEGEAQIDGARLDAIRAEFNAAVLDDINIPKALGVLWGLARMPEKSRAAYDLALEFDETLGLSLDALPEEQPSESLDEEVEALIAARQTARKAKDFAEADRIRDRLKDMGILLEDTREGVKWKRN